MFPYLLTCGTALECHFSDEDEVHVTFPNAATVAQLYNEICLARTARDKILRAHARTRSEGRKRKPRTFGKRVKLGDSSAATALQNNTTACVNEGKDAPKQTEASQKTKVVIDAAPSKSERSSDDRSSDDSSGPALPRKSSGRSFMFLPNFMSRRPSSAGPTVSGRASEPASSERSEEGPSSPQVEPQLPEGLLIRVNLPETHPTCSVVEKVDPKMQLSELMQQVCDKPNVQLDPASHVFKKQADDTDDLDGSSTCAAIVKFHRHRAGPGVCSVFMVAKLCPDPPATPLPLSLQLDQRVSSADIDPPEDSASSATVAPSNARPPRLPMASPSAARPPPLPNSLSTAAVVCPPPLPVAASSPATGQRPLPLPVSSSQPQVMAGVAAAAAAEAARQQAAEDTARAVEAAKEDAKRQAEAALAAVMGDVSTPPIGATPGPTPSPLPPVKQTTSDLEAELQRRKNAKEAAAAAEVNSDAMASSPAAVARPPPLPVSSPAAVARPPPLPAASGQVVPPPAVRPPGARRASKPPAPQGAARGSKGDSEKLRASIQAAVQQLDSSDVAKLHGHGRFTGSLKHFVLGSASAATGGLDDHLKLPDEFQPPSLKDSIERIKQEFEQSGTDEDKECLAYVLEQRCGDAHKTFPNSPWPMDCDEKGLREDRKNKFGGMDLDDFTAHENSRKARLNKAHVLGLRLYTTAAFRSLIEPLRDTQRKDPHPFPTTIKMITEGLKKLREVGRLLDQAQGRAPERDLWRGLKDMERELPPDIVSQGGTELAPMSTTTLLQVAVQYSASHNPMLMRLHTESPMQRGSDVSYLSAFPDEAEYLFPPLTYLEVTDSHAVDIKLPDGQASRFTIVDVKPHICA